MKYYKTGMGVIFAQLKDKFAIAGNTLKLAWSSNLRCRTFIYAVFTNNKITFRQHVLDRCIGSKLSKQYLKGSCLSTPNLFGDVPESFAKRLDASSTSHKTYVLRPRLFRNSGVGKARGSGRMGLKRSNTFNNYQPAKRFTPNFNTRALARPGNTGTTVARGASNTRFFRGHRNYQRRNAGQRGRR